MAIGALLTSMATLTSSLGAVGGLMSSLGGIAATAGSALAGAMASAATKAIEVFGKFTEWAKENIWPMLEPLVDAAIRVGKFIGNIFLGAFGIAKTAFTDIVIPIFKIFKDTLKAIIQIFTGDFKGAFKTIESTIKSNLIPLIKTLMGIPGKILKFGINIGEKAIKGIFKTAKSTVSKVVGFIKKAFAPIKKIINKIGGVLGKAKSKVKGTASAIQDARQNTATTIGAAINGGMNTSVNMTLSLAGMTDKSDKRAYAREIGNMIEDQVKGSLGSNRSVL